MADDVAIAELVVAKRPATAQVGPRKKAALDMPTTTAIVPTTMAPTTSTAVAPTTPMAPTASLAPTTATSIAHTTQAIPSHCDFGPPGDMGTCSFHTGRRTGEL